MAGRILNRQARTKILYNLLAIIPTVDAYNGLAGVMAVAQTALDAGEDVEKVRAACNDQRLILKEIIRREREIVRIFPNATVNTIQGSKGK